MALNDLTALRELAEKALEIVSRATEGPWDIGVYDPDANVPDLIRQYLSYGKGDVHSVWCPNHPMTRGARPRPDHAVISAITGNGPDSALNAAFIAAARTSVPDLAQAVIDLVGEVERLREAIREYRTAQRAYGEMLGEDSYPANFADAQSQVRQMRNRLYAAVEEARQEEATKYVHG